MARFAYNWALGKEQENYKNVGTFLFDYGLRKEFTKLKSTEEHKWINYYSNNITKQATKDACLRIKDFSRVNQYFLNLKVKENPSQAFTWILMKFSLQIKPLNLKN
ncbi:hypothetical protein ACOT7R_17235 [Clostridium perfringens]|uniref:hypothetical protein n=1 Tax=Clostridium perfringens TaxID=1502 RepID=UPI003BAA4455